MKLVTIRCPSSSISIILNRLEIITRETHKSSFRLTKWLTRFPDTVLPCGRLKDLPRRNSSSRTAPKLASCSWPANSACGWVRLCQAHSSGTRNFSDQNSTAKILGWQRSCQYANQVAMTQTRVPRMQLLKNVQNLQSSRI